MRNIHGKVEQEVTPLWDSLISQSERISFHMPGHRQGRSWPSHIKKQLAALDTTELSGTGDLAMPLGSVLDAYERAASCFCLLYTSRLQTADDEITIGQSACRLT